MSLASPKNTSAKDSDEIDISRFIGELIDHRKLILAMIVSFAAIAILYALFATPKYQADALIQVEQKQGNAILNSLSQVLPDSAPQSAPEISLLQSRMIIGKTVDDLNLQTTAQREYLPIFGKGWARLRGEKTGSVKISRLYLTNENVEDSELQLEVVDHNNYILKGSSFDYKGKVGQLLTTRDLTVLVEKIDAPIGAKFQVVQRTRLDAINNVLKNFTVADQGKDTGMLSLTFVGNDPALIAETLDSISQNYLSQNILRQAAQNEKSLEFLQKQLPKVRGDLNVAENNLNEYRRQQDSVDLTLETKSVLEQIVNVDNQLNELTFKEAEISQLFTKEHPNYKALIEKRKTLQEEKGRLNKNVSAMPATQQEVLRLSRDVESGQAVYMQLLNRQQELNIAKSSAIGNVRIIDSALTEPTPVEPKKVLIVFIGIVLGIFASVCIVLFRVLLRRGLESAEQLEDLGINVYASVPVSETLTARKSKGNDRLLAIENPADIAIEAIRSLRTSLHFGMMDAKNNILMISGASPNAGKTFVSTNLAAIIANGDKKVLLIDADMRKGYMHSLFGYSDNVGLSDFLSGRKSKTEIVRTVKDAGFDVILRGKNPPNPAELLMHSRFEEILNWASEEYDIVVIDTPPILAVTDAAIIGGYAGTTLLVARFEMNTAKEIDVSVSRFENSGVTVKGCILNGIVKKASSYYGYGYSNYGYSYTEKK